LVIIFFNLIKFFKKKLIYNLDALWITYDFSQGFKISNIQSCIFPIIIGLLIFNIVNYDMDIKHILQLDNFAKFIMKNIFFKETILYGIL
jgi:hypothetical protein